MLAARISEKVNNNKKTRERERVSGRRWLLTIVGIVSLGSGSGSGSGGGGGGVVVVVAVAV